VVNGAIPAKNSAFEVPKEVRGYNDRNFKSTALGRLLPTQLHELSMISLQLKISPFVSSTPRAQLVRSNPPARVTSARELETSRRRSMR
jgi:hypothetical protein